MNFFTSELARHYSRKIAQIPDRVQIPEEYLHGMTNDEFLDALQTYHELLRSLLLDVERDPAVFGMVCLEIDRIPCGPVTKAEARSQKSFEKIPRLLNLISSAGEEWPDGSVSVPVPELKKIPHAMKLINVLNLYGFDSENQDDKIVFSYPDNRNVLAVMRAFGSVNSDVMFADIRAFTANGEIDYGPEDVIQLIPESHIRTLVASIVDMFREAGYVIDIKYSFNPYMIRISRKKSAKKIVNIIIERDSSTHIHARLANIAGYSHLLKGVSENVLHQTLDKGACAHCSYHPAGGIKFSFAGKEYEKCSVVCVGFSYTDILEKDTDSLLTLLKAELQCCEE